VAAYHVVKECVVKQWSGVLRKLNTQHTKHSYTTRYAATTPRLQYELNCEYFNITLARNRAP